jgi:hypothetical protein
MPARKELAQRGKEGAATARPFYCYLGNPPDSKKLIEMPCPRLCLGPWAVLGFRKAALYARVEGLQTAIRNNIRDRH